MNWIQVAFKLLANRDKLLSMYEQAKPLLRNLPQFTQLAQEIDPDLVPGGPQVAFTVQWMQESLNKLNGDANLVVDGDYGELTRAAVRQFQEDNNLTADGWAGIQTCVELYKKLQEM